MTTLASLNGSSVTEAKLSISQWGASYHEVTIDGSVTLSGAVTLIVADLTIKATVLSGGPAGDASRSYYRLVSGAGGWAKTIPSKSYANDAGVKLSTVLGDAASAAGETLDASTVPAQALGAFWTRPNDAASRVLEQVSPGAWYVGEDGKTRLGKRPATTLPTKAARTSELDLARGTLEIASDTIAGILPGLTIDGLTAVDVEHTFSASGGLRSKIWGSQGAAQSRRLAAWRAIIDQLDPDRNFRGIWEYRIVTQTGARLNLQPIRVSTGMPDLQRVFVRPGMAGMSGQYAPGARVLVGFANVDPGSPVVVAFEDPDGGGFLPTSLTINASSSIQIGGAGGQPAARLGDQVTSFLPPTLPVVGTVSGNPFTGTITVSNPVTGIITGGSAKTTIT